MRPIPLVFVTVDTEEDEWGAYTLRSPSVVNVKRMPAFQELCDRYGAQPTYFANWPVISDPEGADTLAGLLEEGRCELGTHIHPWNTPPFGDWDGPHGSMLCSLPEDAVREKLSTIHYHIVERFGERPTTFRSGRWGMGSTVARVLVELGYAVDSSVTPLIDWSRDGGPDYRDAPLHPYHFSPHAMLEPDEGGELLEFPVSVGFLRGDARRRARLREAARSTFLRSMGLVGALDRTGIASLRWLSPELSTAGEMVRLAENLVARGATSLHLTLHSPSLVPGLTPFVRSAGELQGFMQAIEDFFAYAAGKGFQFEPLGRGPALLGLAPREVGAGEP